LVDDSDPEETRQAPEDRELSWACISSLPTKAVFYADQDLSEFGRTVCVPHKEIVTVAKELYYVTRALKNLRALKVPVPPP